MSESIMASEFRLGLWENQLNNQLINKIKPFHFLCLNARGTVSPEPLQVYFRSIFLVGEGFNEIFQDFEIMEI
jgi:hypothetical protein